MGKTRLSSVAGTFYTNDVKELEKQFEAFKNGRQNYYEHKSRAIIVPHAGFVFSGQLAYDGFSTLKKNLKNIFIFAPTHKIGFNGISLSGYEEWETPFGRVDVNQEINEELKREFQATIYDIAHESEHSVEVQIPFIQKLQPKAKIIPILIGNENCKTISNIIKHFWNREDCGFVISSDLSHFLNEERAKKLDNVTAAMIENNSTEEFNHERACGSIGICGLVEFSKNNNFSLIRLDLTNSSSATKDKDRVVGYGSWFLYEGNKNAFLKKYFSEFIIKTCKSTIESVFAKKQVEIDYAPVFDELGASFVTLKENENLHGCIGSIIEHQPLINDLIKNAQNAAFSDPRFEPLKECELPNINISVSLLSNPEKIIFSSETDLLEKITQNKDGIIIKDGNLQAVYLPIVWEQIPDKKDFLTSLKIKAGFSPEHFSKTFEAYRFYSEYIE